VVVRDERVVSGDKTKREEEEEEEEGGREGGREHALCEGEGPRN
jgi:hypothetical protein